MFVMSDPYSNMMSDLRKYLFFSLALKYPNLTILVKYYPLSEYNTVSCSIGM